MDNKTHNSLKPHRTQFPEEEANVGRQVRLGAIGSGDNPILGQTGFSIEHALSPL